MQYKGNIPNPEMLKQFSGYPLIFVHKKTNEVICEQCAHDADINEICNNYVYDIHYEGDSIQCDSCNNPIASAYGIPENKDN